MEKKENTKSFDFTLKMPVGVTIEGKITEAFSMVLFAPVNAVFKHVSVIDAEFNKARSEAIKSSMDSVKNLSPEQIEKLKSVNSENEKEVTASSVVSEMIQNGSDMNKCFEALREIMSSSHAGKPMCIIDTAPFKKEMFDSLSFIDTKEILGLYIINFLGISRSM